jgi:hypothetical protein
MKPSTSITRRLYSKCLAFDSEGRKLIFVTIDAIGAGLKATRDAYKEAQKLGIQTPLKNIIMSASHTHNGFGGIAEELAFQYAPATDLFVNTC